jgi:hypothetical protein
MKAISHMSHAEMASEIQYLRLRLRDVEEDLCFREWWMAQPQVESPDAEALAEWDRMLARSRGEV